MGTINKFSIIFFKTYVFFLLNSIIFKTLLTKLTNVFIEELQEEFFIENHGNTK